MKDTRKHLNGKLFRTACFMLAITGFAAVLGGCAEKPGTGTTDTGRTPIVSTAAEPSANVTESQSDMPIVIWQYQERAVSFGRLTDNVGFLELGIGASKKPSYVMYGHYMYCLSISDGIYELLRVNLDQLEKSSFAQIKVDEGTCDLLDFGIRIVTRGETIFYDFDFHEIYRTSGKVEEMILVPYKDGYIQKDGTHLRILHLDEEKPFRTLDSENYEITGYHLTGDNVYLIMKNKKYPDENDYTVYDVNRMTYWRRLPANIALNDNGMVKLQDGKYYVSNFEKKKTSSYKSRNPGRIGSTLFDGTRQYFFDEADRKIKYYVPSKQMICVMSEAEFTNGADLKGMYNGYVYAEYASAIYFLDPAGQKEIPGETYINKIKKDAAGMKKNLEFHYRIKFLTGIGAAKATKKIAKMKVISSDLELLTAMNKVSAVLKKLNYNFFDVFKQSKKEGLNILFAGKIDVIDGKTVVPSYSFSGPNAYYIALDIRSGEVESAFCREIMHTIESRMFNSEQVFGEWNRYNPADFAYSEISAGAADASYVPENEKDPGNVYFTDAFACASAGEDRARLFAAMIMPEKNRWKITDYPNLKSKASGLKHVLLTYYPALSDLPVLKDIE